MTDTLFQKVEEKVSILLSELQTLRKEVVYLRQENAALKLEKNRNVEKLQHLISLFDVLDGSDNISASISARPFLQEKEQIAVA